MQNYYTKQAGQVIKYAGAMAKKLKHPYIGTEHLLLGLRKEYTGVAGQILAINNVDEEKILRLMDELIAPADNALNVEHPKESPRLEFILDNSRKEAQHLHTRSVGTEHLLMAIIHDVDCVAARILTTLNINLQKILADILNAVGIDPKEYQEEMQEDSKGRSSAVEQFCTDLTAEAAEGRLDPVVGRE